jgi:hypothetical protein
MTSRAVLACALALAVGCGNGFAEPIGMSPAPITAS